MADIRPIRTEQHYEDALARIAELMDALSPPEGQIEDAADPRRVELDVLSDLVEQYEDRHYPIDFPGPHCGHRVSNGPDGHDPTGSDPIYR